MFLSVALVAASLISFNISSARAADKGPSDSLVQNEITHKDYFNVVMQGVTPAKDHQPSSKTKLGSGELLEWSVGESASAAIYGSAEIESEPGVTRLTELELKKGELNAVTTTFFRNGLRSRTECMGKTSATLQCATASRNLCEGFKVNMKKYGGQLGLVGSGGNVEGAKQQMLNLGQQCSQYASFLDNTLDPNKLMTGSARASRDGSIVENDLKAIDAVRKAAKSKPLENASFKGLSDVFGKGDDVGASSTGMRDRSDRLKNIGADFQVLSKLAYTCADARFVEERDGANEQISKKPHDGRTRP